MWMKHDQNKESITGRPSDAGLLRCPMCKGRGYFEPTQVSTTKNSDFSSETEKQTSVKLPPLQTKANTKQTPKLRSKYSLPSIKNVKNLPEQRSVDTTGCSGNYSDVPAPKDFRDRQGDVDDLGNLVPHKPDSRIMTGTSQRVSVTSSVDSNSEQQLLPSPRTPRNPAETLKVNISKLKTNNWNEAVNALKEIVQLSRFQPHLIESSMVIIYRGIIFLLKSFRSIVVRTACQASNELFATMGNTQRPEFDEVVCVLLQKTADTNKAVRQDANEALDTMVINIPPTQSVRTIIQKGMQHKSTLVRGAAARLLVCVVGVVGVDAIYGGNKEVRGRMMNAGATFMQDGCQEVRNFGRRLMKMLMQHDDFEEVLQAEVNEILFKRIEKTLITMKYKS